MLAVAEIKAIKQSGYQYVVIIETGAGTVQVVSGGNNLRVSQRVIHASPGTYLPGRNHTIPEHPIDVCGVFTTGLIVCIEDLIRGADGHGRVIDVDTLPIGYKITP